MVFMNWFCINSRIPIIKSKNLLITFSIVLTFLTFSLFKTYSPRTSTYESSNFSCLSEFEENILNGKEFKHIASPNCICYAAYDPSYSCIYLYILERHENGHYSIAVAEGGIGLTVDNGKAIASEFIFNPLQMNMIFSPTPIDPHEGYQEITFSDAYLYTSEDYSIIYPIDSTK